MMLPATSGRSRAVPFKTHFDPFGTEAQVLGLAGCEKFSNGSNPSFCGEPSSKGVSL
jgi:hypothetical protein